MSLAITAMCVSYLKGMFEIKSAVWQKGFFPCHTALILSASHGFFAKYSLVCSTFRAISSRNASKDGNFRSSRRKV